MNKRIVFRGYLTFEDSLIIQKMIGQRNPLLSAVFITILILGAVAWIIYAMSLNTLAAVFLLLFMAAFMAGGYRMMNKAARQSQKRIYEKACVKRNGVLKPNEITIKKGKLRTIIKWEKFEKAVEADGIVAIIKGKDFLGFARYMFVSDSAWSEAKTLITAKYDLSPDRPSQNNQPARPSSQGSSS